MHTILSHWADHQMGNGDGWAKGTLTDPRYQSVGMGNMQHRWADQGSTDIAEWANGIHTIVDEWAEGTAHQCWYNYVGGSNIHRKYENSSSTSHIF